MIVLVEIVDASRREHVVQELRAAGLEAGGLTQYSAEGDVAVVDGAAEAHRVLQARPALEVLALVERDEFVQLQPNVAGFAVKPLVKGELAARVRHLLGGHETPEQQKMRLLAMAVNAASDVVEITTERSKRERAMEDTNRALEQAKDAAVAASRSKNRRAREHDARK